MPVWHGKVKPVLTNTAIKGHPVKKGHIVTTHVGH